MSGDRNPIDLPRYRAWRGIDGFRKQYLKYRVSYSNLLNLDNSGASLHSKWVTSLSLLESEPDHIISSSGAEPVPSFGATGAEDNP